MANITLKPVLFTREQDLHNGVSVNPLLSIEFVRL